jgi:hypothetical protein
MCTYVFLKHYDNLNLNMKLHNGGFGDFFIYLVWSIGD